MTADFRPKSSMQLTRDSQIQAEPLSTRALAARAGAAVPDLIEVGRRCAGLLGAGTGQLKFARNVDVRSDTVVACLLPGTQTGRWRTTTPSFSVVAMMASGATPCSTQRASASADIVVGIPECGQRVAGAAAYVRRSGASAAVRHIGQHEQPVVLLNHGAPGLARQRPRLPRTGSRLPGRMPPARGPSTRSNWASACA